MGTSLSPLEIYIMGRVGVFKPFWNIYYADTGVAFNNSDMLVPSASLGFTASDTSGDAAEITGGAVASATTGTGVLGVVCTFFATSLFTFWF